MAGDVTLHLDPAASFDREDVTVTLKGYGEWIVDYEPASTWLKAIFDGCSTPVDIVMSSSEIPGDMVKMIASGAIDDHDIRTACEEVLEVVSGRRWWVAINIVRLAIGCWGDLSGEMVLRGVTPHSLTFAGWIDAAWLLMRKSARQAGESQYSTLMLEAGRRPSVPGEDPESMNDADFDSVIESARF